MAFKFHHHPLYEQTLTFAKDIYHLTGRLPDYEQLGLIAHLRGSSTLLVEEIANTLGRQKATETESGLKYAIGIVNKIAASVDMCHKLGYIDPASHTRSIALCEDMVKRLHETKDN